MRVCSHSWEVTKYKAQIVAQKLFYCLDCWISASAVDALKVAVLDQRHGRAFRARNVVAIANSIP
jgi:ribosomal protein S26